MNGYSAPNGNGFNDDGTQIECGGNFEGASYWDSAEAHHLEAEAHHEAATASRNAATDPEFLEFLKGSVHFSGPDPDDEGYTESMRQVWIDEAETLLPDEFFQVCA